MLNNSPQNSPTTIKSVTNIIVNACFFHTYMHHRSAKTKPKTNGLS